MGWLSNLLGTGDVVGKTEEFLAARAKLKNDLELAKLQGQIDVEKARAEYKKADLQYDDEWELAQIKNSGWKDEYVLILLSIPLLLCFIPFTAPWVLAGFAILAQCPDWYRWLILVIFCAIYGIRIYRRQDSGGASAPPKA